MNTPDGATSEPAIAAGSQTLTEVDAGEFRRKKIENRKHRYQRGYRDPSTFRAPSVCPPEKMPATGLVRLS